MSPRGRFARRPVGALARVTAIVLLCAVTAPMAQARADACPNEAARSQQAASYLPDCRAYEKVSPLEKGGGDISEHISEGGVVQAASDGSRVTYVSQGSFADPQGAPIGSQYISTFTGPEMGWETQNISTPTRAGTYPFGESIPYAAFSSDLTAGLELNGSAEHNPVQNPPLGGEPAGYQSYYVRNNLTGALRALITSVPSEPANSFFMRLEAVSPDLQHLGIRTAAALTPGAIDSGPEEKNLYEWSGGEFQQVNVLPDGRSAESNGSTSFGTQVGTGAGQEHTISDDGFRAVWQDREELYLREGIGTPQAKTVIVDESQGGSGHTGEGLFMTASSDDTKVFFLDRNKLTVDSTASGHSGKDLYQYDAEAAPGHQVTDLTIDHTDAEGAAVQGVLGASEDGSYIYFVASGVLVSGVSAGNCCNLYMLHHDAQSESWEAPRFVASLSGADESGADSSGPGVANDWSAGVALRTARVTPDGTHVAFMSQQPLTGYDNAGVEEVYLYDATTNKLSCASCDPSGAPPTGPSTLKAGVEFEASRSVYQPRDLSADGGRLFFDSSDRLVPRDTDGAEDVYEYEALGEGTCTSASSSYSGVDAGCVYLISSGTGSEATGTGTEGAEFVDAAESGDSVFFLTRQRLVASDTDQLRDLYVARVDGGSASVAAPACSGAGCQGAAAPAPVFATPASVTFEGAGNFPAPSAVAKLKPKAKLGAKARRCKHGTVRKRGRCARTQKARRRVRR
jgi:hypothetical protein